jgi:hypothetical protein
MRMVIEIDEVYDVSIIVAEDDEEGMQHKFSLCDKCNRNIREGMKDILEEEKEAKELEESNKKGEDR